MNTVNNTNMINDTSRYSFNNTDITDTINDAHTLKELFDEQLVHLSPFGTTCYDVADFIKNDNKSKDFLNSFNYNKKLFPSDEGNNIKITKGRARHSAISLLLGLCIGDFCNLFCDCSSIFNDDLICYLYVNEPYINYKLWMCTATNHDYGYFSSYVTQMKKLNELPIKYDLFDDSLDWGKDFFTNFEQTYPRILKNSYQQIKDYYLYSQNYHRKDNSLEKSDHGIIGGVLLYNRFVRNNIDNIKNTSASSLSFSRISDDITYRDILYYKASCLTICQHNIFKSKNSHSDKLYTKKLSHLHHNRGYYIGRKHPLLLLLSLVDTIECVKTFSQKESESQYFQTLTILNSVRLYSDKQKIIIDFSDLATKIYKDKPNSGLLTELDKHIKSIIGMSNWTCLDVKQFSKSVYKNEIAAINNNQNKKEKGNYILIITYKERNNSEIINNADFYENADFCI